MGTLSRQPIDDSEALLQIVTRLETLEATCSRRVLPAGYNFSSTASGIVITREIDGATGTVVFA